MFLAVTAITLMWAQAALAVDPYAGTDPYWILLHEPDVVAELKLSPTQQQPYQKLLDEMDLRFFSCRNKSAKAVQSELAAIIAESQKKLETILKASQNQRLIEILLWRSGTTAMLRDEIATRMHYTEMQRKQIQLIVTDTQTAVTAIEKEASSGKPREPLEKKYQQLKAEENKALNKVLNSEQRATWNDLLGKPFDLSKLGQPAFKAPELINTGEWINSKPLTLEKLRGKVVVLHFYASGCSNCIHNYPWYLEWHERFKDKDVVLLGIHTPETDSERNSTNVRQRAAAANFAFPVLIDGKGQNWDAWGNSMWPSVYIIDQRGYVRQFWPGELKWQGNDGEKYMREQIEKLLLRPR
jgi:peroxiredoxin